MGSSPHLLRAYELARQHHTHPNPRVGAVVVSPTGEVLGEGAHLGPGSPHAEVAALEGVSDPRGATIYVSLEPCAHTGRTPPCADRLIDAGLARVVIGTGDPDARVAGAGMARLLDAGIEVDLVDDPAARELDPGYFHHRETGSPFVTLKYAMTLDGSVAAADGTSQWITSEEARADAHMLRSEADAVIVGAGTLIADDPRLNVRDETIDLAGREPMRVILDTGLRMSTTARMFDTSGKILIFTTSAATDRIEALASAGGEVVSVPAGPDGRVDIASVLLELGRRECNEVLVEAGPTLASRILASALCDELIVYFAPKILGADAKAMFQLDPLGRLEDALQFRIQSADVVGTDLKVTLAR